VFLSNGTSCHSLRKRSSRTCLRAQPQVLVNASMVSAIALMQAEGRYTYITL
jgi:hypothetical protein